MSEPQKRTELTDRPWLDLPAGVARALRPSAAGTADAMILAIRDSVPAYSRPLEGAFGAAIQRGVERALTDFLDDVEGVRRPDAGDRPDIYAALGRGEAREGRSMESLLAAYRVGARVAWRRTAAAGREAGFDAETLSLLAEGFFAFIDELSARSAAGFVEERSAAAGETARRRRALVALLAQSPPAEPATLEAAAREAGWELPRRLAALVWRDDSEQPVGRRLPPGSLVAGTEEGIPCALVPDAAAPGRQTEIERAVEGRTAALGPTVPGAEAWRSLRRATEALRLSAGEAELVLAEERLADAIVHADQTLLRELAERRLAPLDGRTDRSRARLTETLAAWLDHQGNVPATARELHVHAQTVRYRLDQLRELFGDDLEDPGARFELSLAVRAPGAGSNSGP